ncbi:BatA domain-containing protein [Hymenobacter latericus]|uniref:BatA domain-containing protein n=1 Tax=Hymenobacter sp. YIM 151858-1 TaxID=2987688 RepID=UPI0022268F44|nr:BatA domain-containing protein [Hymenobacter sp. YIM 151858-1]UYZ58550.1 BatA domain-containing protein [Hymenobacter sp. YIM 151858-1]
MLTFAHPAALLALAGLLVPLAIHLWNRRPGRVVPVGALRWLTPGANRRMRQLHLTQWPLLLLRLALLGLLPLAVAGPRWSQPAPPLRPQVLLSPSVLASPAWPVLLPTLDSLRRSGAELRYLGAGFRLLPDSLPQAATAVTDQQPSSEWYWARAAQAANSFPNRPLRIYTTAETRHFRGTRPLLPARVRWQTVPAAADSGEWLQAAVRPTPDSLRLVIGYGSGARTTYRNYRQAWPAQLPHTLTVPELPALQLVKQGKQLVVKPEQADSTKPSSQPNVLVQQPLRVAVYFDAKTHAEDARYVRAALRAAASAFPAGLQLQVSSTPPTDSLDWLIWLSNSPAPAAVREQVKHGLNLLKTAGPQAQAVTTSFSPSPYATAAQLFRRAATTSLGAQSQVLWQDAAGQPLLVRQPIGRGAEYSLRTRVHPQWSSLPTDGQLPEVLLNLLAPDTHLGAATDYRQLDAAQVLASAPADTPAKSLRPTTRHADLQPWVALAAGLLFGLERLVARRRTSTATAT